jgi:hypothetical protein
MSRYEDQIFANLPKLFVKLEGVWHEANAEQTETLCGLDPQDVQDARENSLPTGAKRCPACEAKAK